MEGLVAAAEVTGANHTRNALIECNARGGMPDYVSLSYTSKSNFWSAHV